MKYLKSFIDKDFFYSFEKESLRLRNSFALDDISFKNTVFSRLEALVFFEEIISNFQEDDIKNILLGNENPLLKSLLKMTGHIQIQENLFEGFELEATADQFIATQNEHPFQLYALNDKFSSKKIKKYREYYGYHFLNLESLHSIEFNKNYQSVVDDYDLIEVSQYFKPFNSLVFIDPYILSNEKNTSQLLNLLASIFPERLRLPFYIDIITTVKSDQKYFDTQLSKLKSLLNDLSEKSKTRYLLNVHLLSDSLLHDRNYFGNGLLINMGHGLQVLQNKSDSAIKYYNTLHPEIIETIKKQLLVYEKYIVNVGDNPIWNLIKRY